MMNLVSVVVPVYNVEKYLRHCVDSILNQTYRNIEVILVDDGSTDDSPVICDEYAQRDSRVNVIHKKNGGQSSARNVALDNHLTGDYVTFVDSDDWIAPDTYMYCMALLEKYNADSIQFEIALTSSLTCCVEQPSEKIQLFKDKDVLQYFMLRSTKASGGYSLCTGLFRRNIIENIRFREGKINEDIDYKYRVMQQCKSLIVTNQTKYFYYQAGDTTSTSGLKMRDFQLREAANLLCEMASKEEYGSIAFLGKVKKARTAFSLLCKIAYFGVYDCDIDKKKIVKELKEEHRDNLGILLKAPIPMSRKMLAIMFAINFNITETIIHIAKSL